MTIPHPSHVRASAPAHPFLSRAPALLLVAAAAAPASAQSYDVLVSTTSATTLSGVDVGDADVMSHRPFLPAAFALPGETLSALAGDPQAAGLHLVLGNIDALHVGPGALGSDALYVSVLSNENGFLDGDLLRVTAGGIEVAVAEDAFRIAAGTVDSNLDIDAVHIDPDGTLFFSFAENEDSSTLSGDTAGVIGDGDVLVWPAGAASAQIHLTESQIDAMVSQALGAATSTTDTRGLARDPANGSLLFVVQSPTAHDGSVFSTAGGGTLVAGHEESSFDFGNEFELDALTVQPVRWPGLSVSNPRPQPGDVLAISLWDADADQPHAIFFSLDLVDPWLPLGGWGGLVLGEDEFFSASASALPSLTLVPDAFGRGTLNLDVPPGLLPFDLVIQAVRIGPQASGSNPVLIEVGQ